MQAYLNKLVEQQDLTSSEAELMIEMLFTGNTSAAMTAALLTALRMKGESVDELYGAIVAMRNHMLKVQGAATAIDTCGTGGDGKGTFNISTTVAIVAAAAGVPVVKHGNRNASSKCGSADVLEALGVNINLSKEQAEGCLKKAGMVFLFAPLFHPAMKHVVPVRKELKIRTIFNFLGPFANPAGVKRQIIGVPNQKIAGKLAETATKLGYEDLAIISGHSGMDELSLSGVNHIFRIRGQKVVEETIDPEAVGMKLAEVDAITGGDANENAKIIKDIMSGKSGPYRDTTVLNAALACQVAGTVKTIKQGIEVATQTIDSGKASETMEQFITVSQTV